MRQWVHGLRDTDPFRVANPNLVVLLVWLRLWLWLLPLYWYDRSSNLSTWAVGSKKTAGGSSI